jgi:hypothetical protein
MCLLYARALLGRRGCMERATIPVSLVHYLLVCARGSVSMGMHCVHATLPCGALTRTRLASYGCSDTGSERLHAHLHMAAHGRRRPSHARLTRTHAHPAFTRQHHSARTALAHGSQPCSTHIPLSRSAPAGPHARRTGTAASARFGRAPRSASAAGPSRAARNSRLPSVHKPSATPALPLTRRPRPPGRPAAAAPRWPTPTLWAPPAS